MPARQGAARTPLRFPGLRNFLLIWIGQLVSLLGSGLTSFALGVWIYQRTGSVTLLSFNMLAYSLPHILLSPVAGHLVDRWDRRTAMIVSDLGAGVGVAVIAALSATGRLAPWNIYLTTAVLSGFNCLQWPAWSAATTLLVPREHLGRANGMIQIAGAVSQLAAPAIAGALYVMIGIGSLVAIDAASYLFAVLTMLFLVKIPAPPSSAEGHEAGASLGSSLVFGWKYIAARPGLLGLLLFFAGYNFLSNMIGPLIQPLILDTWSPQVLGFLGSVLGVGMMAGTLAASAWGGFQRRIYGLLGAGLVSGAFLSIAGLRPSIPLFAVAGFGMMLVQPLMNASSQAIWQSKVEPDVQGRVFSVRRMIAWSTSPLGILLAAPLADRVFKPLLVEGGPLAASLGRIFGVGSARGIGLQISLVGILTAVIAVIAFQSKQVRRVELELPDAAGLPAGAG
jgi:DHA3 family macrolide efflux protein-like MFS transporter